MYKKLNYLYDNKIYSMLYANATRADATTPNRINNSCLPFFPISRLRTFIKNYTFAEINKKGESRSRFVSFIKTEPTSLWIREFSHHWSQVDFWENSKMSYYTNIFVIICLLYTLCIHLLLYIHWKWDYVYVEPQYYLFSAFHLLILIIVRYKRINRKKLLSLKVSLDPEKFVNRCHFCNLHTFWKFSASFNSP